MNNELANKIAQLYRKLEIPEEQIQKWKESTFDLMLNHIVPNQPQNECLHPGMKLPKYDPVAAKLMSVTEIKRFFPRGSYDCPICRSSVITYASFEHYIAGDW